MIVIKRQCPAKINIFLKVVGKRADGYHELESLITLIDLYDILEVAQSTDFKMEIDGEFAKLVDPTNNLLTKILDYFALHFKVSKNLNIKLTKNILVGAGLGGGSSDAATFLQILNEIYALNLTTKELQDISLIFGSDISFFLAQEPAIIRGRGEIVLKYQKFPAIPVLLVSPNIAVSTKEVFSRFKGELASKHSNITLLQSNILDMMEFENDLEAAAIEVCPEIATVINILKENQARLVKMSGSGSACFAIFNNSGNIQKTASFIEQNFPHFFAKPIKIITNAKITVD